MVFNLSVTQYVVSDQGTQSDTHWLPEVSARYSRFSEPDFPPLGKNKQTNKKKLIFNEFGRPLCTPKSPTTGLRSRLSGRTCNLLRETQTAHAAAKLNVKSDLRHTERSFQTRRVSRLCFWKQLVDTVQRPVKLKKASVRKSALTNLGVQVITPTIPTQRPSFHCPMRKQKKQKHLLRRQERI